MAKDNEQYRHKSHQFVQGKREKNPHDENKMGPKEYFELLHLMHCKERKS